MSKANEVQKIKVGDTVRITKPCISEVFDMAYFNVGDTAVIIKIDGDGDLWGDFNQAGNSEIKGDGCWCITEVGACELVKAA